MSITSVGVQQPSPAGHVCPCGPTEGPARSAEVLRRTVTGGPAARWSSQVVMPAPTVSPHDRQDVAGAADYLQGDRVWVYRHGGWQPGVVEQASDRAVMVTYRVVGLRGSRVDTVTAPYLAPRTEPDAFLDFLDADALPLFRQRHRRGLEATDDTRRSVCGWRTLWSAVTRRWEGSPSTSRPRQRGRTVREGDRGGRLGDVEVTVRSGERGAMVDTGPGHAIVEVLDLCAADGDIPRFRRGVTGPPDPHKSGKARSSPSERQRRARRGLVLLVSVTSERS